MDADELNDQFDRMLALLPLAKDVEVLEEIATNLDIVMGENAGNKRALQRQIILKFNSAEFDALEDREGQIVSARDKLLTHLGFEPGNGTAPPPDQAAIKADDDDVEEEGDRREEERRDREIKVDFAGIPDIQPLLGTRPRKPEVSPWTTHMKLKDFKIDGQIGQPGEPKKLTYSGLVHQVNSGIERGYPESEICAAVIKAIQPGDTTRIYLEGKKKLKLEPVMKTLKAHFCELDVTSVYNKMIHAVQGSGPKDTALTFVMGMFAYRDQIVELSRTQENPGQKYEKPLVQSEMQRSIYAGLKDESIRQDLKQLLKKNNLDDHELMEELTKAVISQEEHERRLREAGIKKKAYVSSITTEDEDGEDNSHPGRQSRQQQTKQANARNNNNKTGSTNPMNPANMDPFLAQIQSIVGAQVKEVVQPLQTQIHELQLRTSSLNPKASTFSHPKQSEGGQSYNGKLGGSNSGTVAGTNVVGDGFPGLAGGEEYFVQLVRQALNLGVPTNGGQTNLGTQHHTANVQNSGNGGPNNTNGGQNKSNQNKNGNRNGWQKKKQWDGISRFVKCQICRDANALACNHCLICHGVDHGTPQCPKKDDPTFTPKN